MLWTFSAERPPPQGPTGDDLDFERAPWQRVRSHHNWLYFTEPEVFSGVGSALQPLLTEGENLYMRDETSLPHTIAVTPLFAIGSLTTENRIKNRHRPIYLLATAAGVSGETLRLMRIWNSQMGWGDGSGENVALYDVSVEDIEDETTWTGDARPISKIKFAANDVREERARWQPKRTPKQQSTILIYKRR